MPFFTSRRDAAPVVPPSVDGLATLTEALAPASRFGLHHSFSARIPYAAIHGKFAAVLPPDLAELTPAKFSELAASRHVDDRRAV